MADLITVPTFTFQQGKLGDTDWESPIQVHFYNGSISLEQEGNFDINESIQIHPKHFQRLFKEIKKHLPEAKKHLEKCA